MQQYLGLLKKTLEEGELRSDRTGTGVLSSFGHQLRYNLKEGFPLVTTKKIHFKSVVYELLWFLSGETNVRPLQEKGVRIWNEWADELGDLGPVYGKQWRSWSSSSGQEVDQMTRLVEGIKKNPLSRRHIVNSWNVGDLDSIPKAPPPCHTLFQFYVSTRGELSCQLYQRSADLFLGVPFNIASYALLTHMVAQVCNLKVGDFVHTMGDAHIYSNHLEQVKEQLKRKPFPKPQIRINPHKKDLFSFEFEDFELLEYECHPLIKGAVAV